MRSFLERNELLLLAYLYQHGGTDWGECDGVNPFRVRNDLRWGDRELESAVQGLEYLGLAHADGIPVAPLAERMTNLVLTIRGRDLLWLLENAFSAGEIAPQSIIPLMEKARGEIDELVCRFLQR